MYNRLREETHWPRMNTDSREVSVLFSIRVHRRSCVAIHQGASRHPANRSKCYCEAWPGDPLGFYGGY